MSLANETELRNEIVRIGRLMHQFEFVDGASGNLSARLGPDRILTTPSGLAKGFLSPDQLILVDMDGKLLPPALPGLKPGNGATACEKRLWGRLVTLQAAAYRVLSDVDDDGVAEAHDMAVLALREAVAANVEPKTPPEKRIFRVANGPGRRITTR